MNKKIIWLIIGLMSAAVVGLVALQVDLIRTSIRVNEDRFDKNVFTTLNIVAQQLEAAEAEVVLSYVANGYTIDYLTRDHSPGEPASNDPAPREAPSTLPVANKTLLQEILAEMELEPSKKQFLSSSLLSNEPVEERIRLDLLDKILAKELTNHGINAPYEYGVYSVNRHSFVIHNGIYVVENPRPEQVLAGYEDIYNSPYRVTLFDNADGTSPGLLLLHFPSKNSLLWSSLRLNFLGTFLFALIILLCFGYTVWVIFRQKKLSEMKTDFINNMTHEFKTPIATISLAADSIVSPRISGDPDKVGRFANIIKQENKRMNSQVEKVLQMALIDKREFKLNLTEVDLHEVIQRAIENISLQVEQREGTAQAVLDAERSIIEADLTHVSNIINNLLDNANKYSPDQPDITVHTRNVAQGVEVAVTDKGVGLSKEARKQIFDKFYRVPTGNLHDVKGFGLGLSYVKAMMTAHRGTVDVKSDLGKGSSFILFFPFRQPERN